MKKTKNQPVASGHSAGVRHEEFSYRKEESDTLKRVFIDLDDAYGVPFSSAAFVLEPERKEP